MRRRTLHPSDSYVTRVMRRRRGSRWFTLSRIALSVASLVAAGAVYSLVRTSAEAASDGSIADDFAAAGSYSGSTGSLPWVGPWSEIGEADGATLGYVTVADRTPISFNGVVCATDNCLIINDQLNSTVGALRSADLSGSVEATLTFTYLMEDDGAGKTRFYLEASTSPGGPWTRLATYEVSGNVTIPVFESFDLQNYISATTSIRFVTEGRGETDELFVDDVQISASSTYGLGVVVYNDDTAAQPSRWWDGAAWTSPVGTDDVHEYVIMQGAAARARNEMIVVGVNKHQDIRGMIFDGSTWQEFSFGTVQGGINETFWWGFDVAYESVSGDAMLVWNNDTTGTAPVSYRVWNGTTWTAEQTITVPLAGEAKQMRLAANPLSDEMVLVVSNDLSDDYALVWDGSAWGNPVTLSAVAGSDDRTDIFVEYEQSSGHAMVVYGRDHSSLRYRTWNGVWSGESSVLAPGGVSGNVRWTTLAANPGSDEIVVGVSTFNSEIWAMVWRGSSWTSQVVLTTATPDETVPSVAVGFESSSGQVVAIYDESSNDVRYRTWSDGTGWSGPMNAVDPGNDPNSLMLYPDPSSNSMIALVQDADADLVASQWDGSAWSLGVQLENDTKYTKNQPFLYLWDLYSSPAPPVFDQDLGDRVDAEGAAISFSSSATDPNGGPLSYSATGLPPGITIHPATGLISGTIGYSAAAGSPYSVQITVEDPGLLSDVDTFNWAITDTPVAVDITKGSDIPGSVPPGGTILYDIVLTNNSGTPQTGISVSDPLPADTAYVPASTTIELPAMVRDRFDSGGYAGSDGSVAWSSVWTEDSGGGAGSGVIRVVSSGYCSSASCLRIGGDEVSISGRWVARDTDLTGYASAVLTLDRRRVKLDDSGGTVTVEVRGGGTGWTALDSWTITTTDSGPIAESYDITGFIGADTEVRFIGSGTAEGYVYVDDVSVALDGTVTIAGGAPPNLASGFDLANGESATVRFQVVVDDPTAATQVSNTATVTTDLDPTGSQASVVDPVNAPPVFDQDLGDRGDAEGDAISFSAAATDPGDTLTYSATGLPAGISIDPGTGQVSGTVAFTASPGSPYAVQITVTDSGLLTDVDTFSWSVADTNRAPGVTNPGNQSDPEGGAILLAVAGSDPDLDNLTWSAVGLPAGLSIAPGTGVISGTVDALAGAGSPYSVTVTATDDGTPSLFTDVAFSWTVTNVNRAPNVVNPGNQAGAEGDVINLVVSGTDPDLDTVTWSAVGLPTGLSIDPGTGVISGTVSYAAAASSPFGVTVTATDDGVPSLFTDALFTWTIADTNRAPNVVNPGNQSDSEADVITMPISGSDPDLDTITWSAAGLPDGLSIDPSSGTISGTITQTAAVGSPFAVTVTATDDGTPILATDVQFSWTVAAVNLAPVFDQDYLGLTSYEGETISIVTPATDPDLDTLTWSATGLPTGLSVDPGTGIISGTIASGAGGTTYSVQVTVTDPGTLDDIDTFEWKVATGDAIFTGTGVEDTEIRSGAPTTPLGSQPSISIDLVNVGESQGLLRFGGIVGSGPGQIPAGSTINDASMLLWVFDEGSGQISLHRMLVPWTEASTWSTMGGGISTDGVEAQATADAVVTQPWIVGTQNIDGLEPTVQAWVDGASNEGWALFSNSDNGWDFHSTEYATTSRRPRLVIDFTPNAPPTFNQDITNRTDAEGDVIALSAGAIDPEGHSTTYAASGLPLGLSIDLATGLISGTIDYAAAAGSPYSVTITATDQYSAQSFDSFTWNVSNTNRAPTPVNPGGQFDAENDTVSVALAVTDPDLDTVTWSAVGLPQGLSIGLTTGVISGTIDFDAGAGSPHTVTVTATDDGVPNLSNDVVFTWTVSETNRPPALVSPGDRSDAEGDAISLAVAGSDPDLDTITWTAVGLPDGLSIDPGTGVVSGAIGFDASPSSPFTVTVTATDDGVPVLATDVVFTWTVANTNRAPLVTDPGDRSHAEGDPVTFSVVGTDPDLDTITWSATDLPGGLSIDPASGIVSGTVDFDSFPFSPYTVTVTATDDGVPNLSTDVVFTWEIADTNRAPIVTNPGQLSSAEGEEVSVAIVGTDPDLDSIAWVATGLPGGLAIDSGTGVISGTVDYQASGVLPYTVTVTASDNGVPIERTDMVFSWRIVDTNRAPVMVDPGPQNSSEGGVADLSVSFSDPDGDSLELSATGLPPGLSVSGDRITGTLGFEAAGEYTVSVIVTDDGSPALTTTIPMLWTVTDTNRAPVVTDPGDRTDAEGDTVTIGVEATDPDGDVLTLAVTGLPAGVTFDPTSERISGTLSFFLEDTYLVTITATDDGSPDLASSVTFTWTIGETNRPPLLTPIEDQQNEVGDEVLVALSVSDPDGDAVVLSVEGLPDGVDFVGSTLAGAPTTPGSFTVTVTATDDGTPPADDIHSFLWVVEAPPGFPDVDPMANLTNTVGDEVDVQVVGSHPDDLDIAWTAVGLPDGLAIDSVSGVVSGSPTTPGTFVVQVTVTDELGQQNRVGFVWFILPFIDLAPEVVDDTVRVPTDQIPDGGFPVDAAGNDTDPEGGTVEVITAGPVEVGEVSIVDGLVLYLPEPGWIGTVSFPYSVEDPSGNTASGTITIVIEDPLEELIAADVLVVGPGGPGGVSISPTALTPSTGTELVLGTVFQSLYVLRLPLALLGGAVVWSLLLGGVLNLGFVLHRGIPRVVRRSSKNVAIVLVEHGGRVDAREGPGTGAVVARLLATDRALEATGRRADVGAEEWVEIRTESGKGWVPAFHVTEDVDRSSFADDPSPIEVVTTFMERLRKRDPISDLIAAQGLFVAHHASVIAFRPESIDSLLDDMTVYTWKGRNPAYPDFEGTFDLAVATSLLDAFDHPQVELSPDSPVVPSTVVPVEFTNFHFVSIGADVHGRERLDQSAWLVMISFEGGTPKIAGLCKEG